MTFAAYGIALPGIPEAIVAHHPSRTARWSMPYSSIEGAKDVFVGYSEDTNALAVGWKGWGSYRVDGPPDPAAAAVRAGADEIDVAACFLASVLPFALPLFGMEPFHGSAVAIGGAALCLLGDSGAGKSSLAAALSALGYDLVTDDACAIDAEGRLWPGPGLLSLLGGVADGGRVVARGGEKSFVAARAAAEPLTPGAILRLDRVPGGSLEVRRVRGREAFEAMVSLSRAPDVLAERRVELQLTAAAAAVSSARFGIVSFDPLRHDTATVAETVADWASCAHHLAVPR